MSETITLPSGGSVTLRDPGSLRGRDKQFVRRHTAAAEPENTTELSVLVEEFVAVALVTAWSVPYLPSTQGPEPKLPKDDLDAWGELEIADLDAILAKTREMEAVALLFPKPPTPDDAEAPGSPTGPTDD